jgi:hypothetical protein
MTGGGGGGEAVVNHCFPIHNSHKVTAWVSKKSGWETTKSGKGAQTPRNDAILPTDGRPFLGNIRMKKQINIFHLSYQELSTGPRIRPEMNTSRVARLLSDDPHLRNIRLRKFCFIYLQICKIYTRRSIICEDWIACRYRMSPVIETALQHLRFRTADTMARR